MRWHCRRWPWIRPYHSDAVVWVMDRLRSVICRSGLGEGSHRSDGPRNLGSIHHSCSFIGAESARGPATIRSPVRNIPPPPLARTRRRLAAGHRAQMHLSHQLRDAGGRRALLPRARLVLEAVLRASREHDGDCLRSAQSRRTTSSYAWGERPPSSLRSGWRGTAERCCYLE